MQIATLEGHTDLPKGVDFASDGTLLASAGTEGMARIWKAASLAEIDEHPLTIQALYRKGLSLNRQRRFREAKSILTKTLAMQETVRPRREDDILKTRVAREVATHGLGPPPDSTPP